MNYQINTSTHKSDLLQTEIIWCHHESSKCCLYYWITFFFYSMDIIKCLPHAKPGAGVKVLCFCVEGLGGGREAGWQRIKQNKNNKKINKAKPCPCEADILPCCNKPIIPNAWRGGQRMWEAYGLMTFKMPDA